MQARQTSWVEERQTNTSTWLNLRQFPQQVISISKQLASNSQVYMGSTNSSNSLHCSAIMRSVLKNKTNTLSITGYFFKASSTPMPPSPIRSRNSTKSLLILGVPKGRWQGWFFLGNCISKSELSMMSYIFWRYWSQSGSSLSKMSLRSWKQKTVSWAWGLLVNTLIFLSSSTRLSWKKEGQV